VASRELAPAAIRLKARGTAQLSALLPGVAHGLIQRLNVLVAVGQDDLATFSGIAHVGGCKRLPRSVTAVVHLDVATRVISAQSGRDRSPRKLLAGVSRPCVTLTTNLGNFRCADVLHDGPERSACFNGGELLVVAQQDDFRAGLLG